MFAQMAAKCNSRSDKIKIILQPRQTQREKLFHFTTQTAHSLQESEMHFVQKLICLLKKLKSGLERSKVIWVASTRKRSNFHIGRPFGIAGGWESFQQSTRI